MAEKILNTRLVLKHDSLTAWQASKYNKLPADGGEYLKNGEIAVVNLGNINDGTTATNNNNHPVLFKVGTGAHTFDALPFASALAADVYAWAKAENVILNNKTIEFKKGDTVVKSIAIPFITESEANGLISTALAAYSTTEQMNAAIKVETDRALEVEGGFEERIAELEDAVGTEGSVSEAIKAAVEALDATVSHTAGADGLALSITEVDGKITAISGSIAANTYDAYGSAAAAQSAAEATAAADATAKANAAQAAAEGKVTELANNTYTKDQVDGFIAPLATTEALNGVKATAEQGVADAAEAKGVADAAKARIDTFLDTEGVADTVDSLHDIKNWMEGEGVNATELTQAIAAETKAREDGDALKVDKTTYEAYIAGKSMSDEELKAYTDGKFTEANLDQYTTEAEVKGIKVDNATNADQLGGTVAANYALKTDVESAINNIASISQGNASVSVSDSGIASMSGNGSNIYVGNDEISISAMGTSISSDLFSISAGGNGFTITHGSEEDFKANGDMHVQYPIADASAANKQYVDEALAAAKKYADDNDTDTTYTAKAGGGLKLEGTEFSIDDSITFVFDCGTSAN